MLCYAMLCYAMQCYAVIRNLCVRESGWRFFGPLFFWEVGGKPFYFCVLGMHMRLMLDDRTLHTLQLQHLLLTASKV